MDDREDNRALIAFTTLAPLAVGGLIGLLALQESTQVSGADPGAVAVLVVGIAALLASLFHLGRPFRAYRAIVKLSTSWLSREVLLFGLFLLGLALYAVLPGDAGSYGTRWVVGAGAAVVGLLSLLASGSLYRLQSRPAWDHWITLVLFVVGALSAGVLLGLGAASLRAGGSLPSGAGWFGANAGAGVALLAAAWLTWVRLSRLREGSVEARESWRLASVNFRWALVVRLGGCALALVLLVAWMWPLAWIPAALAELADRVLFFETAVPVSFAGRSGVPGFAGFPSGRR